MKHKFPPVDAGNPNSNARQSVPCSIRYATKHKTRTHLPRNINFHSPERAAMTVSNRKSPASILREFTGRVEMSAFIRRTGRLKPKKGRFSSPFFILSLLQDADYLAATFFFLAGLATSSKEYSSSTETIFSSTLALPSTKSMIFSSNTGARRASTALAFFR